VVDLHLVLNHVPAQLDVIGPLRGEDGFRGVLRVEDRVIDTRIIFEQPVVVLPDGEGHTVLIQLYPVDVLKRHCLGVLAPIHPNAANLIAIRVCRFDSDAQPKLDGVLGLFAQLQA